MGVEDEHAIVRLLRLREAKVTMNLSDFEDLGIISDFEEDEDSKSASGGDLMTPTMPTPSSGDEDRPRPPWQGHREKLVGVVDMGRRVIIHSRGLAEILTISVYL